MKKICLLIIILSPILFFSCKSGNGNPKAVMLNFFEALSKKDISTARKLSTDSSKKMIDFLETILSKNTAEAEKFDKSKLEIGDAVIDGDHAFIPVTENETGETLNYILRKVNGNWKMAFDEESIMNMGVEGGAGSAEELKNMPMDSLQEGLKKGKEAFDSLNKEMEKMKH